MNKMNHELSPYFCHANSDSRYGNSDLYGGDSKGGLKCTIQMTLSSRQMRELYRDDQADECLQGRWIVR
jgi:hypothetical protein